MSPFGFWLRMEDGRTLPANYKQFTHGYAVTAHRSQGKSVDAVIISADGMRRKLFYVAASRGRESIMVITSDKERLREEIGHSDLRQSASELDRKRDAHEIRQKPDELMQPEQASRTITSLRDLAQATADRNEIPNKSPSETPERQEHQSRSRDTYSEHRLEPEHFHGISR